MTIGPIMMGAMLDLSGDFTFAFLVMAVIPILGLVWTARSSFTAITVEQN
jgi:cyanate permease